MLLLRTFREQHSFYIVMSAPVFISVVPIGMTVSTPISGIISDHRGPALPALLGLAMATIGSLLLTMIDITGTYILTCLGLFLSGLGIGMFTPPNNSSVMRNVPKEVLGISGGILNMSRTLGMGLGVTFGGLTYQFFLRIYNHSHSMIFTFRLSYCVIAVFSFVTLIITFRNYKKGMKNVGGYHSNEMGV